MRSVKKDYLLSELYQEYKKWMIPALLTGGALLLTSKLPRNLLGLVAKRAGSVMLKDPYSENLWELISAGHRATAQVVVETGFRAEEGKAIKRPLGSPKRVLDFDGLTFNIAQLATAPTPESVKVDTSVIIGPQAKKPMRIEIPLMVTGMAFGFALSERAKLALAKGATLAGTATNSGENGFFPDERKLASKYIVQYHRGNWKQVTAWCEQADMIEIQLGQGASAGTSHTSKYEDIPEKTKKIVGLKEGQDAIIQSRHKGITKSSDYSKLVEFLREKSNGVPIGVKLGAGNELEKDMEIAVEAGVDFIALDGAEAATVGSEPILQDAFGLPSIIAVCRGAKFLRERGLTGKVSLIIGGGLFHPEHFLKALALGADAIYLGTVCLFAISHHAIVSALPWEPPTTLVWAKAEHENALNINKGAKDLAKFFKSCQDEMISGIMALGKTSVRAVDRSDMAALDPQTSAITGVPLAY